MAINHYQTSKGQSRWTVEVYHKGKKVFKKTYKSEAEAVEKEAEAKANLISAERAMQEAETPKITLKLLFEKAKSHPKLWRDKGKALFRTVQYFLDWVGENTTPQEITEELILDYIEYLTTERGNGNKTINVSLSVIGTLLKAGVLHRYYRESEVIQIKDFRLDEDEGGRKRYLSHEEEERFLDALDAINREGDEEVMRFFKTLRFQGCRPIELFKLQIRDIDLVHKRIRLLRAKKRNKKNQVWLPMMEPIVDFWTDYMEKNKQSLPTTPVFFRLNNNRIIAKEFIKIKTRMGIDDMHLPNQERLVAYCLRHTSVTRMVKQKEPVIPITLIQQWHGHADLKTTLGYYHSEAVDLDDLPSMVSFNTPKVTERLNI